MILKLKTARFVNDNESKLKVVFRNSVKSQYPEVGNFLGEYFETWMQRENWLEHEVMLKVLMPEWKLEYLGEQIQLANFRILNNDEFKNKVDRLYNQSYSQWEDWYAELRAIEYLNKQGFHKFKYIKEENNQTPDFEAWKNNESTLVEVKQKHYSDDDKIFDEFDRKLCAESIRDEMLRKSFGSNFQENPGDFKKLLDSPTNWKSFVEGLKEKIQADERWFTFSNEIKVNWMEDCGEFSLSDRHVGIPPPRPRGQNIVDKKKEREELRDKFSKRIEDPVNHAICQLEKYEKTVKRKFDLKYIIYFINLNTAMSLFQKEEINQELLKLKNVIKSKRPEYRLEIIIE
ncbi:MAG: hypothetical protein MRK02_03690 [Candidatus Scalindua sp.]|nr:hypothetical protein [Candidatus Scalindua sp.]